MLPCLVHLFICQKWSPLIYNYLTWSASGLAWMDGMQISECQSSKQMQNTQVGNLLEFEHPLPGSVGLPASLLELSQTPTCR